jgi:hypothetical protein
MTGDKSNFKYDVFISYRHQDSEWVNQTLLPRLEAAGLRVRTDKDFEVGMAIEANVEDSIRQSRVTLLVLTPDYLASKWTDFEMALVDQLEPATRQRRVIPVMLQTCELPLRIRSMSYADFTRSEDADAQFQRLLTAISSKEIGDAESVRAASSHSKDYRLADIRELLVNAFSDEELTTLCYDHFRMVYEDFAGGMSKGQKTQRLLDYCVRHEQLEYLLAVVKKRNRFQYLRFESRLSTKPW